MRHLFLGLLAVVSVVAGLHSGPLSAAENLEAVVVPKIAQSAEGQGASAGLSVHLRMQEVYLGSEFPQTPITIQEVHFRPDITYSVGAFAGTLSNIRFRLSTTSKSPSHLSAHFEENTGPDVTEVYNGSWSFSTAFEGPDAGPKRFDIVLPLQTPFRFDPSNGNLLLEYQNHSTLPVRFHTDAGSNQGLAASMIFRDGDADAEYATSSALGADALELVYSLDLTSPPRIVALSPSQNVTERSDVVLSVNASGSLPLNFQWLLDGLVVDGATSSTLILHDVTIAQSGAYSVMVTNAFGGVTSDTANLRVSLSLGETLVVPTTAVSSEGAGASAGFSNPLRLQEVYASSQFPSFPIVIRELRFRPDITYGIGSYSGFLQRIKFLLSTTSKFPSGLSSSFADNPGSDVSVVFDGAWSFTTAFDGPVGAPKKSDIILTLQTPFRYDPAIGNLLLEYQNYSSLSRRFHTDATGVSGGPASLMFFDGNAEAVTASAATPGADVIEFVYAIDDSVPPSIIIQPIGRVIAEGSDLTLSVGAVGPSPLVYQWRFEGVDLPGRSDRRLTISSVSLSQSGDYSVSISNRNGVTFSHPAVVQVVTQPGFYLTTPTNADTVEGSAASAAFSVPFRQQEIYSSALFTNGPVRVEQLKFRLDETLGGQEGAFAFVITNIQFRLSTARTSSGSLSSRFIDNAGLDETVVFDGPWLFASQLTRAPGKPLDFDIILSLQHTFVYDPSRGDLLVETRNFSRAPKFYAHDGSDFGGAMQRIFIEDPNSQFAAGGDASAAVLKIGMSSVLLAPSVLKQPVDQTVEVGADVSFSITVGGSRPSSFQWLFNGEPIAGAVESSLALRDVSFAAAGHYSVAVSNPVETVLSHEATLTVKAGPAKLRILDASVSSGGVLDLAIQLTSNGNENGVAFSLTFDPSLLSFQEIFPETEALAGVLNLNTVDVTSGHLGLALALPSETTFIPGTRPILRIRFYASSIGTSRATPVTFGDDPIFREVVDALADPVSSQFQSGEVSIVFRGFEGDVAPRANPDRKLTLADWVQVGRFAAALDEVASAEEFQRIDCAPRESGGDGLITVRDWVQAGRYVAGLDPIVVVGGPTTNASPLPPSPSLQSLDVVKVSLSDTSGKPGDIVRVPVTLAASGGEAAIGFSVAFDPAAVSFAGAELGKDATGGFMNVNSLSARFGRVGVALALPGGSKFTQGEKVITVLKFAVQSVRAGSTPLGLGDAPVRREVVDSSAVFVPSGFSGAGVAISPGAPELGFAVVGESLQISWAAELAGYVLQYSPDVSGTIWIDVSSAPQTIENHRVVGLPVEGSQGYFRLRRP